MGGSGIFSGSTSQSGTGDPYWNRSLGTFYYEYSHRLVCHLLLGAGYIVGTFATFMLFHGPLLPPSRLSFIAAYAIHTALIFTAFYALFDFAADRYGPDKFQYQKRTVGRQWLVMLIAFLVSYAVHRSTYVFITSLYASWLVEVLQTHPEKRWGVVSEFLYFFMCWVPTAHLIVRFSLHHQNGKAPARGQEQAKDESKPHSGDKAAAPPFVHQVNGGLIEIGQAKITHVSMEDHYCRIYHINGQGVSHILLRLTLKQVQAELSGDDFIQIHRSHLVNLRHALGWKIEKHKRLLVMEHGTQLPISRGRMAELKPSLKRLKLPKLN